MSLSDITRKQARSDLQSRLNQIDPTNIDPAELNWWLNMSQFDVALRLSSISNIWYGTTQTVSITAAADAVTEIALTGNYAATKIMKMVKLVLADGETVVPFVEDNKINSLLKNSHYDGVYAVNWFGEKLYVFVGVSATALSSESATLYFIRKPDEMGADASVKTITLSFASIADDDTVTVDGIVLTVGAATTEEAGFVKETDATATGDNLEDLIDAIFSAITGVSSSSAAGVVTVTGAKTITTSNTTGFVIADSTSATIDVPTEFYDLLIMSAMSKAVQKLNMSAKAGIDQDISAMYQDIRAMYGQEAQILGMEQIPGVQSQQRQR